jgi:hypothetical protein
MRTAAAPRTSAQRSKPVEAYRIGHQNLLPDCGIRRPYRQLVEEAPVIDLQ